MHTFYLYARNVHRNKKIYFHIDIDGLFYLLEIYILITSLFVFFVLHISIINICIYESLN